MKIPNLDTIRLSAVAYLRDLGAHEEADLLSRSKLEVGDTAQRYMNSTQLGLTITLRCRAADVARFVDASSTWDFPSAASVAIQSAIEAVLPGQFKIHDFSARALLVVDRSDFEKSELERLIERQIDLMTAVATGGPRIEAKNDEYKELRQAIDAKARSLGKRDHNPFEDLWAWYGRWRSGDLPSYQSRREYVRDLYRPLLEDLRGVSASTEPSREPTGWERVDRTVDRIISSLGPARTEEEYQAIGLLCRECIISLAQAVFDPARHRSSDGTEPSNTDALRMLDAYFSSEFSGSEHEALRRHAKASLSLANSLQHKRTAKYKDAALCSEATRTVVNIVAIMSAKD